MKKIYVDELPDSCEKCGFFVKTYQDIFCNALRALSQNRGVLDSSINMTDKRHLHCPLILARTYATEEIAKYLGALSKETTNAIAREQEINKTHKLNVSFGKDISEPQIKKIHSMVNKSIKKNLNGLDK